MAPKHDEIVKDQSGGWTIAWDTTAVEPATRKAFDKVIAGNARALREVLGESSSRATPPTTRPSGRTQGGNRRAGTTRRARASD